MTILAINFILVVLISFTILAVFLRRAASNSAMRTRLKTIHVAHFDKGSKTVAALKATMNRRSAARLIRYLRNAPFAAMIEKLLREANSPLTVLSAALISASCALAVSATCFLLSGLPILAVPAFLLGSVAPYGYLLWQRSARLNAFNALLPDALELMTRALRAGHALASAIEIVGQESPPPLGPEFASVFQQQKLGVRFREALLEMGERIPSGDLHFLITAILVQRETGGDITEILERTTYVIRERWRIGAEVKTRTAQGKLTGWILGLLPVVMLVLINLVSPGYSHILFHDPTGQKLLYAGAGFIVVGGLVIRKIVDVRV
jgi:tight adherence protein B